MFTYLKHLLIVVFLTATTQVFSQIAEGYSQATLTFVDGKIEEGFIKDIELMKIDKNIRFKKNLSDKNYQSIKPDSLIKSITLSNGERYETLEVKHPLTQEVVKVFSALVAKGELSLYEAIHEEEEIFVLVKKKETYWLQNDRLISGEDKIRRYRFRNIFYNAISDAQISESVIADLEYNRKAVLEVIQMYNIEKGATTSMVLKPKKPILFLITGGSLGKKVNDGRNFTSGSSLRIFFPRLSKSFSLNTGLRYQYFVFDMDFYNRVDNYLGNNLFELPIEIQHNFLKGKFRPFAFVGTNLSFLKLDLSQISENTRPSRSQIKKDPFAYLGYTEGFSINSTYGLGVEYSPISNLIVRGAYAENRYTSSLTLGLYYCLKLSK
jgi:hypothetical protein